MYLADSVNLELQSSIRTGGNSQSRYSMAPRLLWSRDLAVTGRGYYLALDLSQATTDRYQGLRILLGVAPGTALILLITCDAALSFILFYSSLTVPFLFATTGH